MAALWLGARCRYFSAGQIEVISHLPPLMLEQRMLRCQVSAAIRPRSTVARKEQDTSAAL